MAIRSEDWVNINKAIDAAINKALEPLKPHGLRRVMLWLKEWGAISAIWAVPLSLLAIVVAVSIFAFNGISKNATFQATTEGRLNDIEKSLSDIHGQLTQQIITSHAALTPEQFKATLPALSAALATAQKDKLSTPPAILSQLQQNLVSTDSNAVGFWPTAAEFINYQSSSLAGVSQVKVALNLPRCNGPVDMDNSPDAGAQAVGPDGKPYGPKIHITRVGLQDCYFELDGQHISGFDCTRCLIRYSGGPFTIRNSTFKDCLFVFDFPVERLPAPEGRRFTETLLAASDLRDVSISGA